MKTSSRNTACSRLVAILACVAATGICAVAPAGARPSRSHPVAGPVVLYASKGAIIRRVASDGHGHTGSPTKVARLIANDQATVLQVVAGKILVLDVDPYAPLEFTGEATGVKLYDTHGHQLAAFSNGDAAETSDGKLTYFISVDEAATTLERRPLGTLDSTTVATVGPGEQQTVNGDGATGDYPPSYDQVAVTPDRTTAIVLAEADDSHVRLVVIDTRSRAIKRSLRLAGTGVEALVATADGKAVVARWAGKVRYFPLAGGTPTALPATWLPVGITAFGDLAVCISNATYAADVATRRTLLLAPGVCGVPSLPPRNP